VSFRDALGEAARRRRRRSYVIRPGVIWLGFFPQQWSKLLA
jgi:hypothetical protein